MSGTRSSVARAAKYAAPKILVADDDDGVRAGLVANLELEGYQVFEARDGAEAIELLGARTYDLIVSDVVMPAATGVEVLCAVREQNLVTPFILISAFVSEELVTRALGEGLFAMLYKPFAMDRILEVVARALKRNVVLLVDDTRSDVASLASALPSASCTCSSSIMAFSFNVFSRLFHSFTLALNSFLISSNLSEASAFPKEN